MPKEKITDQSALFDVSVGWERDRDVQIGLSTHDGRSLPDVLGDASFDSIWASLDRADLNRLIRALRRARDAAYGRDE